MTDDQKYLAVAPHFTLHQIGADTFLLLSEDQSYRLKGEMYGLLMPHLNGQYRFAEIRARLGEKMPDADIVQLINHMRAKGYVVAIDPWADRGRSAFWSASARQPDECEAFAQSTKIAVVALGRDGAAGSVQASALSALLIAQGFTITDFNSASLSIVLAEDYLQPAVADFARMAFQRGMAWIPFKPGGAKAWFGPLIGGKGENPNCYFCLARRLAEHRQGDRVVGPLPEGVRPARAYTQATLSVAFGRAVLETTRLAFAQSDLLRTKLHVWSLEDGENEYHSIPLFGDCPEHSGRQKPERPDQFHRPIRLSGQKNQSSADGGWRVFTPEQVLEKLEPIVDPLTGIVSYLHKPVLTEGLHVYAASQGRRMSIDPRQNRSVGMPNGAGGKGLSDAQAKISCLAEAVERYGAQWSGSELRHQASWNDVRDLAPHPYDFLDFAENQYQNRDVLNRDATVMARIPVPFDDDAVVDWTPAWSLRDDAPRWLPTRFCYFEYAGGPPGDHEFCWADSNGCATGGNIEEAILQGFLEVVERDALSVWWYNRLVPRRISLDGLNDAFVDKMQAYYRSLGREIWVIDVTTDLEIPVMIAVSAKEDGSRILLGFGAHLDGKIAALRSLTELNQMLLLDETGQGDDRAAGSFVEAITQWLAEETLADYPYIAGGGPEKGIDELPAPHFETLDAAVRFCVDRVAGEGLDTIIVDYSRDDLPLACVRVVVPGLRHFWNRRGTGRLFDAPVKMGVLQTPRSYDELNPMAFFL